MDIMEWAKANAKEGANFAELEDAVERSNPLAGIKSREDAEAFIRGNDTFRSALDSSVSKAVESHDKRFREEKLPGILSEEKERLRKELNPEETEEQRQIRELREEVASEKKLRALENAKSKLRSKGKEFGFPDGIAETFAVYGEEAEDRLSNMGDFIKRSIQEGIESGVKEKFKGRRAPESGRENNSSATAREDFDNLSPKEKMKLAKSGGAFVD